MKFFEYNLQLVTKCDRYKLAVGYDKKTFIRVDEKYGSKFWNAEEHLCKTCDKSKANNKYLPI